MYFDKYNKYIQKYIQFGGALNIDSSSFIDIEYGPSVVFGKKEIKAVVVPHAGSFYVKEIMDYVFNELNTHNITHIIVIATNHTTGNNYQPLSTSINGLPIMHFKTVDQNDEHFKTEHSTHSLLPYLQLFNLPVYIVSIGVYSEALVEEVVELSNNALIIGNTDLLHCGEQYNIPCDNPYKINQRTIQQIIHGVTNFDRHSMCGKSAIHTFVEVMRRCGYKYSEHVYSSSDLLKPSTSSVGYVGIVYNLTGTPYINRLLLQLPRKVMSYVFSGLVKKSLQNAPFYVASQFRQRHNINIQLTMRDIVGIFVTIEKNKELRGCIGTFSLIGDLIDTIINRTVVTAFSDYRFPQVEENELTQLTYKINFLHKPFITTDVFNDLVIGLHGITVYFTDGNSATYLASVLPELGLTKENVKQTLPRIINMLKRKAKANGDVHQIELYECLELDEIY